MWDGADQGFHSKTVEIDRKKRIIFLPAANCAFCMYRGRVLATYCANSVMRATFVSSGRRGSCAKIMLLEILRQITSYHLFGSHLNGAGGSFSRCFSGVFPILSIPFIMLHRVASSNGYNDGRTIILNIKNTQRQCNSHVFSAAAPVVVANARVHTAAGWKERPAKRHILAHNYQHEFGSDMPAQHEYMYFP